MEPKRITLSTINTGISSNILTIGPDSSASVRFGADFFPSAQNKQKTNEETNNLNRNIVKTLRFNLELFQPDSTSYPSFNYSKLIAGEKKKQKKVKDKQNGYGDPFEVNDDDVARIARELEKKYGNSYGSGKGRNKKDDFCDIGMGYDESDSFIDNTEAYDEVVPEEVETIEGGFYINCGALEFKSLRPEKPPKTRTDDIIKMPERPKKMIITSSSDSDESDTSEDDDDENSDSDDDSNDESSIKTTKSKDSSSVPSSTTSTVKSLKSSKKTQKKTRNIASSSNSPRPESDLEVPMRTAIKDVLKARRDKFIKIQSGENDPKTVTIEIKSSSNKTSENESSNNDSSDSDDSDSSDSEDSKDDIKDKNISNKPQSNQKDTTEKLRTTDTKLPDLEEDVKCGIQQFRETVKALNLTGKRFQFNESLKDQFLKIDESLLCVEKARRNMVFAHLEFHLTLPKYYFLRKAKQLRIKEEKQKTCMAIDKLGKAISEVMAQSFINYNALKNAVISGGDGEQVSVTPKRKFLWNSHIRTLLYEAYQVRWTSYPVLGTRKQTLEEFISGFMKAKVLNLWPQGWMTYDELQKEIEKQKNVLKKSKMKEKANNSNPNTNVNNSPIANPNPNPNISLNKEAAPSNAVSIDIVNYKVPNTANLGIGDDTENRNQQHINIVSNKAGSLKRKNSDALIKATKSKSQKLNPVGVASNRKPNDQIIISNTRQSSGADIALDLVSPTKKFESKINVVSTASLTYASGLVNSISNTATCSSSNMYANSSQHSKVQGELRSAASVVAAAHIIDLDNYSTTSEILKTTKKLAAARVSNASVPQRNNDSDDNDCVEFVGIIQPNTTNPPILPTKNQNYNKPKTKKSLPSSGRITTSNVLSPFGTFPNDMASIYAQNLNSSNIAKSANELKSLMSNLDALKVMKSLEELNRNYVNQQNSLNVNALYNASTSTSTSTQGNKQKPSQ